MSKHEPNNNHIFDNGLSDAKKERFVPLANDAQMRAVTL